MTVPGTGSREVVRLPGRPGPYPVLVNYDAATGMATLTLSNGQVTPPFGPLSGSGAPGPAGPSDYTTVVYTSSTTNDRTAIVTADAGTKPSRLAPGSHLITSDMTLTKTLDMPEGALLNIPSGITVTLAGISGPRTQKKVGAGKLRFTPGAIDHLPVEWFLDTRQMSLSTYDSGPGLREAALCAADMGTTPPSGAYPTTYMGGMLSFPRGPMYASGEIRLYNGTGMIGQGRTATSLRALDAAFSVLVYDERGNQRCAPILNMQIDGRGLATNPFHMRRAYGLAVRDVAIINGVLNAWVDGSQQCLFDNVDLLGVTAGATTTNLIVDRSSRNFVMSSGTVKGATQDNVYITQSLTGETDSGQADAINRPLGIRFDGVICENAGRYNYAIDAGGEVFITNGKSAGAGVAPLRIAARVAPVLTGTSTAINTVQVTVQDQGLNGGALPYAVVSDRLRTVDNTLIDTAVVTSFPLATLTVQGRKAWSAATAFAQTGAFTKISPDEFINGTSGVPIWVGNADAVTAGLTKYDVINYGAGLLPISFTDDVGSTENDGIAIPPGTWEIWEFIVTTSTAPASPLTVSLLRNGNPIWTVANRATVTAPATLGSAGAPIAAQALLTHNNIITVVGSSADASTGQRFVGTMVLRALP